MGVRYWFGAWYNGLFAPASSMVLEMDDNAVETVETLTLCPWPKQPVLTLVPKAVVAMIVWISEQFERSGLMHMPLQ